MWFLLEYALGTCNAKNKICSPRCVHREYFFIMRASQQDVHVNQDDLHNFGFKVSFIQLVYYSVLKREHSNLWMLEMVTPQRHRNVP